MIDIYRFFKEYFNLIFIDFCFIDTLQHLFRMFQSSSFNICYMILNNIINNRIYSLNINSSKIVFVHII